MQQHRDTQILTKQAIMDEGCTGRVGDMRGAEVIQTQCSCMKF